MIRSIVFAALFAIAAARAGEAPGAVPSFDFRGLVSRREDGFLAVKEAAKEVGAFSLSGMPEEFNRAVSNLKGENSAHLTYTIKLK